MNEKPTRHGDRKTHLHIEPVSRGDIAVRVRATIADPEGRQDDDVSYRTPADSALLAGRVILGGYLLYSGINHFLHRRPAAGLLLVTAAVSVLGGTYRATLT